MQLADLLVVTFDELKKVVKVLWLDLLLVFEKSGALGVLEVVIFNLFLTHKELLRIVEVLVDKNQILDVVLVIGCLEEDFNYTHEAKIFFDDPVFNEAHMLAVQVSGV